MLFLQIGKNFIHKKNRSQMWALEIGSLRNLSARVFVKLILKIQLSHTMMMMVECFIPNDDTKNKQKHVINKKVSISKANNWRNEKGGGEERPASLILQALLPNQGVQDISVNKMNCYLMKIDAGNKNWVYGFYIAPTKNKCGRKISSSLQMHSEDASI